ncbi:hypothetical protein FPV67DRAFT_927385 [Lyophyllum atratum]|nr:hypothetical protein FPV67DRAFT_927385 [Lyophyllum atratum]
MPSYLVESYPTTVQNPCQHHVHTLLRDGDIHPPTHVLHRLVLTSSSTVGRPLWEYTTDLELLMGFLDALQAHKELCDQGILHRDITPRNVLLAVNPTASLRAFISDLDIALIESSPLTKPEVAITTVERGTNMMGTAQFMAREILENSGTTVHKARHDIESFIWVLLYCVLRSLHRRASHKSAPQDARAQFSTFKEIFSVTFGQTTPENIALQRHSFSRCMEFSTSREVEAIVTNFMSAPLVNLFAALRRLVHPVDPFQPISLTHEDLLAPVDSAIALLP